MDSVDYMVTSDTTAPPCGKLSPVSNRLRACETPPVLRTKIHPNAGSEQIQCSREEGKMGTNGYLPARAADTSSSLKDTSDVTESPSRYINERIQQCPEKTPAGQKSNQGFGSEGAKSKDTIKMDEPIARRTRRNLRIQHPSKALKDKDALDKADTEVRELLLQLIAQNKEQRDQIKAMNLVLEKVLEQQASMINELHGNAAASQNDSQASNISIESMELVKPFKYPRVNFNDRANMCRTRAMPTTDLDGSDVSSLNDGVLFDNARVCMATHEPMDTSINLDGSGLLGSSSNFNASQETEALMDTSPSIVRSKRNSRSARQTKGRYNVPKEPEKVRDKAQESLSEALDQVPDTIHFNRKGKRTKATLYVGNWEYKASKKELNDVLDAYLQRIRVEEVVLPKKDGRPSGFAFVTLSWAEASNVDPSDICKLYSGMIDVKSRPIYFRELYSKVESVASDDSVSSEYLEQMDRLIEELQCKLDENNRRFKNLGGQVDALIQ